MNKSLRWKIILLFCITIFSAVSIVPSFNSQVPSWWKKYLAPQGLKLGLDLQGGMHLVLKVDVKKAIDNSLDFAAQDLKEALLEKKISVVKTKTPKADEVVFTLPNKSSMDTIKELIKADTFSNLDIKVHEEEGSFPRLTLGLKQDRIDFIKKNAVNQSLEIIRNRIDQFGVAEPVIIRQGEDEIVVELPGVKDASRALALIGQTAQLEFKMVVDNNGGLDLNSIINKAIADGKWQRGQSLDKLNMAVSRELPPDTRIYFETNKDPQTKTKSESPLLIQNQVMMSGDMVADAQVRVGGTFNEPYVTLELTGHGGKVFGQVTEKNVNKRFAIILDGNVKSAPVIREKIMGGSAQISGNFTYEEASDLAIVLRIGALPAPVDIIQNLTVGASLGRDSIHKGINAGLVGTALVFIFMIFYYRGSGINACVAVILNILLVFVGLAFMNGTLTMPGIAGIILSIGMAVDSNILIFERMREEFALGKSPKSGVEAGYDRAFWTIVDAHVSNLITSLALFLFGTGPIKGFAVTLSFGILFNLFTTLFGTRVVYDFLHSKRKLKQLKFRHFIGKTNIDFMGWRKVAFTASSALAILGVVAMIQIWRGQANLGIDFSGGSMIQYQAAKEFSLDEARAALKKHDLGNLELQQVTNENQLIVKIKKSFAKVENINNTITSALNTELPDKHFTSISESSIGSSVSESLRDKAFEAILISMLGVIAYLAVRFNFRYGIAAAVATFHDVLAVLGICYLMNIEITLLIITALLTLAGFSLNDTVVIFDRIRETSHRHGHTKKLPELINISVNEVLSRTITTSLTAFLAAISLFFLGGEVIHDFSFALLLGFVIGTYSSVFIASPILCIGDSDEKAGA
jgi:SecD/SecF fusion protein